MNIHPNPMCREYTPAEWAAAKRVGLTTTQTTPYEVYAKGGPRNQPGGPLLYATGDWHPGHASKQTLKAMQAVTDWQIVEAAMRREWKKGLPQ